MKKSNGFWSVGRLVIGILLIVLAMVVLLQSCATGVVNTMENSDDAGGSAGFITAIFMIASGVVGICTRNSTSKAGPVIVTVLLVLGAVLGFCNSAVYSDLAIWSVVNAAFAVVFAICAAKTKKGEIS